jgi:hypothetical protein
VNGDFGRGDGRWGIVVVVVVVVVGGLELGCVPLVFAEVLGCVD